MAAHQAPRPWDSPGKNTGVGCHFLLQCMKVKSENEVSQPSLTLSDTKDCSLPGSSVHGTFQARVLERGAIAFSRAHSSLLLFQLFHWNSSFLTWPSIQFINLFSLTHLLPLTWSIQSLVVHLLTQGSLLGFCWSFIFSLTSGCWSIHPRGKFLRLLLYLLFFLRNCLQNLYLTIWYLHLDVQQDLQLAVSFLKKNS